MFCGECGAKNKPNDTFCLKCGAKLEKSNVKTTNNNSTKSRKPISKKNKMIIIIVLVIAVFLGIFYKIGSDITNPKSVAKEYIQAVINQDGNELYKYLEIEGDKTFVSKKVFSDYIKSNKSETDIINYKITDVEYADGKLNATVKFKYTTKNSSTEKEDQVILAKQKGKRFLIFDNWKVNSDLSESGILKDFTIKVTKDSKVTFSGVKLTDKYLDKEKSTSKYDVYVLPQVFKIETVLKAVLPSGFEIEEKVTPSSYDSTHTVSFDEDNLTDAAKEKIINVAKESLTTVYNSAIAKKSFNDIKSKFEYKDAKLTDLEKDYTDLVDDLNNSSTTLTSIEFTDFSIYDIELNSDGFIEVELSVDYDYSVKYESYSGDEETHEDSDYGYMTVILTYVNGTYYLAGLDDLDTYFSRY